VTENRFNTAATDWDKENLRIELAKAISSRIDLHHDDCEQDFDQIFSVMTLHHLADIDCILAKLFHCLKSGGIIALAEHGPIILVFLRGFL
jgi:2-polyprenyl-3-methyl-5-hydroxy-6-metoxy-1,4-benzoquinol methylase